MSSLRRNFLYNYFYQILIMITPLITTPYISRVLGAEGIGAYSYHNSIAQYFVLISMLGINNYGNRSIAKARGSKTELNKTFTSIYCVHLIYSVIVLILYLLYICVFISPTTDKSLPIILTITIIASVFDINWLYFGLERFRLTVTRNSVIKITSIILIFIFVNDQKDLWIYVFIMSLGTFLSNIILWLFMKENVKFVKVSIASVLSHSKPLFLLFIPVIATSIFRIMDKVMLGSMTNMTILGFYENSEKIIAFPQSLVTVLGTVMLPKMSYLYANNKVEQGNFYLKKSFKLVMFMSSAIAFGIAGIANEFAPIFFGSEFSHVGIYIMLLSPTVIFIGWANILRTQFLIPQSRDKEYITSVIIGAILNLIINLALIPIFGIFGAIAGTLVAEFSVALYQTLVLRNDIPISKYFKQNRVFLIFGLVMFIIVRYIGELMGSSINTLFYQVLVGAAIYLALSYLYFKRTESINISVLFRGKGGKNQ